VVTLSSRTTAAASGLITRLLAAGTHTLYAQVDSYNNRVPETDETNNVSAQVYVAVAPGGYRIYLPLVLKTF
jgi:subtilase family serine protease